jgi:hypothetical protein
MNRWLRDPEANPISPADQRRTNRLRRAIARAVAPFDMVVHRGTSAREWQAWASAAVGRHVKGASFLSSSIDRDVARGFMDPDGGMVEIRVRRGYAGATYVHRVPQVDITEYDLVVGPGARFKVISSEPGRIVVEVVGERLRRGRDRET